MPIYEGNLHDLLKRLRHGAPEIVPAKTGMALNQILDALDFVHTRDPPVIHRDIKPPNILYRSDKSFLTDFGIAKVVDSSSTAVKSEWYIAPEVRKNGEQTTKVDIWGLGVTIVECLAELPPEEERHDTFIEWEWWYEDLQVRLNQHAPHFTSMLAVDASRRPTACDLLKAFKQSADSVSPNPPTNSTSASFGASSLANQVKGTTMMYSAAPTPMDWTQTIAIAFFHGNPLPTQRNGSTQPQQPSPAAIQSPNVPANRPARPTSRRKGSVKSAKFLNERQKKGHKRNGSSQNGYAPSRPVGVPKRTSSRKRRPSIQLALEIT